MKTFEYNWATAEMAKLYLRNSRAQEARARKAHITPEVSVDTAANPGSANNNAGTSQPTVDLSSKSDSDSSSDEDQ